MSRLVWVPAEGVKLLAPPPPGLEIAGFPADIETDPRLAEVEFMVPPIPPGRPTLSQLRMLWGRMPRLRVIQTLSAGVDWIIESVPDGVAVCSARGAHDVPVAEWVLAAILAAYKDLPEARDHQREGRWRPRPVGKLAGSTVALVGYGSIGRAIEERLKPFGVSFRRVARRPREGVVTMEALPEVLAHSDIVVILLPLTAETRRVVDARFLGQMRHGALLVNAARGAIVDTDALVDALQQHRLQAVVDVTDPEPLPAGHPLWQAPGVLITPHIAGTTADWVQTVYGLIRKQLTRWAKGEPLLNVVEAGY